MPRWFDKRRGERTILALNKLADNGDGRGKGMSTGEMLPRALLIVGLAAPVLMVGGALGARFGAWSFRTGFQFLFTGAFVAAAVLLIGVVVLVFFWRTGRGAAALPIGVGLAGSVLVLATLGWQYRLATTVPSIHDVSTDRADPPMFAAAVGLRGADANPLDYSAAVAERQAAGYPGLATLHTTLRPSDSFDRAVDVAEALGWRIVHTDAGAGRLEATDATFWFGFTDDVVVRVRRAEEGGSLVDLRSASRVGESDLGANAARIERFIARFEAR